MFDYEEYEKECNEIRLVNNELLELFEEDMTKSGLSLRTIRKHLSNVDFYINEYLLREEPYSMEEGIVMIDMFLGFFFIRKCTWSTPETIKTTAASIKKFYKCMMDHDKISKTDYKYLCSEIKDKMAGWQEDCDMYNDPEADNPFDWF